MNELVLEHNTRRTTICRHSKGFTVKSEDLIDNLFTVTDFDNVDRLNLIHFLEQF